MVALMIVLTIVVFIIVDILSRTALRKYHEAQARKEREMALDIGLKLNYTDEAPSLKRVEVDAPRARILAVDDEGVVLDSFRKILVIAGYAVDTVETGPEAVGLVRRHDYDFVFTDLKMPEMDGLDVTKAVKHFRPDVDVVIITGYATIESAVAAMKFGAMDYVQKPFTEEELVDFVNKCLIRRQDRIEREIRPSVHLVTPSSGTTADRHQFNVPAGVFIAPTHTWASMALNGMLVVGIDDFALKLIGRIDAVALPDTGRHVAKGDPLFTISQGTRRITFPAPVSGRVASINVRAADDPGVVSRKPYELGWLCRLEPSHLQADLKGLRVGAEAVSWYQDEIDRYFEAMAEIRGELGAGEEEAGGDGQPPEGDTWAAFSRAFLHP